MGRCKSTFIVFVLVLIVFSFLCYGEDTYINEKIVILESGDAQVSGNSNVNFFKDITLINNTVGGVTSQLTDKEKNIWIFNLSSDAISSDLKASDSNILVVLPKYSMIDSVSSPLLIHIESENELLAISFSGSNKPLQVLIQYEIVPPKYLGFSLSDYIMIGFAVLIIVLIIIGLFFVKKKKGRQKEKDTDKKETLKKDSKKSHGDGINVEKLNTVKLTLNETQIKIIDALLEKKGEAKQTAIMYMTNIPKASLSRNIELLSQKEIVQKFYNGTSNYIKIHPQFKG